MSEPNVVKTYSVEVERLAQTHYRATNPAGASLEFGAGEGLLSPVELLLAAVAGCTAVDVDVVTSRRGEPSTFRITAEGDRVNEAGASRLSDVRLAFDVTFPDTPEGRQAQAMVGRLVQVSHDKDCTVSRTVERPTNVTFKV